MKCFKDINYLKNSKLDLYLPNDVDKKLPLIVFIHGGWWSFGDKSNKQIEAWLKLLKYDYAVASINYRLSNEINHPIGINDCKKAINFLKEHSEEYNIDKTRIAVTGESAGAHIALMIGLTKKISEYQHLNSEFTNCDSDISCLVAWSPITDLRYYFLNNRSNQDARWNIQKYLGLIITDPDDKRLLEASPINYISKEMPPILLQQGDNDSITPVKQTIDFYIESRNLTDNIELTILENAKHADSMFRTDQNILVVKEFLDKNLKKC